MNESPRDPSPTESLPPDHPASAPDCRFNPWLFFGFLVLPAVASLLTLLATGGDNYGEDALMVLAVTTLVTGLVCGIHFTSVQRGLSPGLKLVIGTVSIIGCAGVAVAIAFGGCMGVAQLGAF